MPQIVKKSGFVALFNLSEQKTHEA